MRGSRRRETIEFIKFEYSIGWGHNVISMQTSEQHSVYGIFNEVANYQLFWLASQVMWFYVFFIWFYIDVMLQVSKCTSQLYIWLKSGEQKKNLSE